MPPPPLAYDTIHRIFYDLGCDLLTTAEEYDGQDTMGLHECLFKFAGPCGHIRIGTIEDAFKICPHCVGGRWRVVADFSIQHFLAA